MPANLENAAVTTGLEKSVFTSVPKKRQCQRILNHTIALISHASKVMLKIIQARLQQLWTVNFQMFTLVLEKAEEPEIKLLTSVGSSKKQEHSRKTSAAAAKSLQLCPTLCDPIDGNPPGSAVPGILQARTLEWVAISFSNAWKWKVNEKLLSRVRLIVTPWTAVYVCFIEYAKAFDCVDHNKLWKILTEMGKPDHLTCLLRNLYAG